MKTMRLGKTELVVSRIGFGGIPIQRLSEADAVAVVKRCLDLGVTFFDTANGYSTSEQRIGKALATRRNSVVVATKTAARDRAEAAKHLDLSLRRMNTDYVDLWQFHNVSTLEDYEQILAPNGAMEAAQSALTQGKIRHIGISSHSMDIALRAVASDLFETLQFPFNFVINEAAQELLPLAVKHDVGFIAMKAFAGGMLHDAALAIKFLLEHETVLPDPGVQAIEEIEEIVALVQGSCRLSCEERERIERLRNEVGSRFCRRCGYCLPCSQDVNIPLVMNFEAIWARMPRKDVVDGRFADAISAAENCARCGECETRCPYHLPIREMIEESIAFHARHDLTP